MGLELTEKLRLRKVDDWFVRCIEVSRREDAVVQNGEKSDLLF